MKIGLVAALMIISANANAGDSWLEINGLSKHIGESHYVYDGEIKEYNGVNFGLGYSKEVHNNVELKGGFYENSYYETTLYLGGMFHLNMKVGNVKIKPGILAGVVTGYQDTPEQASKVQPLASALVNVEYERVRVGIGYLPSRLFGQLGPDVVSLQLGFKL